MSNRLDATPEMGPLLTHEGPGEFRCDECGAHCTRGPGGVEYGHRRNNGRNEPTCSRRPSERVDPVAPSEADTRFGGDDA